MNKKAVKFFEDNGCLMTYLLDLRKQPTMLLDSQVKAGAESYYLKLKSGEIKARPPQYAAGVWEEAKKVKYSAFLKDNVIIEDHKKIVEKLKDRKFVWMLSSIVGWAVLLAILWGYHRGLLCQ